MYGKGPKSAFRLVTAALILWVGSAQAQLQVTDNLSMTLNGNLGFGYTGSNGSYRNSVIGKGIGVNANLDGAYFHPDFLNFNVHPYFNRASANADSQAITMASGVGSSVNLFGGSYFPGSVSYGLDFSDNSQFNVGGIPSVVGNSKSRHFGITWSELLPHMPHVYVSYGMDHSNADISGAFDTSASESSSKLLNINADYRLGGWDLRGNLTHNSNNLTTPEFLTGESITLGGSGTTYGIQAQHKIPLGGMGLGYSHSTYSTDRGGGGSGNNFSEGAGITLFRRLSLNETFNYTTNTTATISQTILNGSPEILLPDRDSKGLFFYSTANLPLKWGISLNGHYSYRQIEFNGQQQSDNQYGGSVSFNQRVKFLGFLTFSAGFVDTANKEGNTGAGLVGTVAMSRKFGHWETQADFSYTQSMQTLYQVQTTSAFGYGGSVHRKLNPQTFWTIAARATHSALTVYDGNSNKSETFSSSLSWKRYTVSGNYAQSEGIAVLTTNGQLVPTPIGSQIADLTYVYNAKVINGNAGARLFRRLTIGGGYTNFKSNNKSSMGLPVLSDGDRYFVRGRYLLRRFEVEGGYTRVNQDVSTIPGGPRNYNTYYISLSRWFNLF
jgi:hypothetical protein